MLHNASETARQWRDRTRYSRKQVEADSEYACSNRHLSRLVRNLGFPGITYRMFSPTAIMMDPRYVGEH